jgi:hypothetical protein
MNEKRTKVIERLRKLREKTVENGCSEAEAFTAMAMIGRIMNEHNIAMGEVEIREEAADCIDGSYRTESRRLPDWARCLMAIAEFTGTKAWRNTGGETQVCRFFGLPTDVETALALIDIVNLAVTWESARWTYAHPGAGRSGAKSFRLGMVTRICERLREMKREQDQVKPATGTALIVLKNQLVDAEYAKKNLKLKFNKKSTPIRNEDAFLSGLAAGDRVGLGTKRLGAGDPRLTRA